MAGNDPVGRVLGEHYRVVEKIGEGGMGEVYKAVDQRLDRTVALKLLSQESISDDERRKRFVKEAQSASALEHPTIVTIHDMVDTGDEFFIVMQYVEGQTLRHVIHAGKIELSKVIDYAIQLAEGLIRAHGAGVIHRDLKPENLMITSNGQLKILDFGLAKLVEPDTTDEGLTLDRQTLTREGHILGTVQYMSPEQAHGKKIDARSDIFSFGSVFYELVTGWRAFEGKSLISTIAAITRDEPKPARHYIASIPVEIEAFIERALQKDPSQRFQTMEHVRGALAELQQKLESGNMTPADRAEERRDATSKTTRALLVGAGVVAAVALTAWFGRRPPLPEWESAPLTQYAGIERDPALSPDGSQIAFAWNGGESEGSFDLYVMLVSSPSAQPLRLTDADADDISPVWSRDSARIAFLRKEAQGYGVHTVPALRGATRRLAGTTADYPGLSFSADGVRVAIVDRLERMSGRGPHAIYMLSTENGDETELTRPGPDADVGDTLPVFSPDGRNVAFVRDEDLYVVSADGGEPDRLSVDAAGVDGIAWTPDSYYIVYASDSKLWAVPSSGGDPTPVQSVVDGALTPTIGPNAKLAYAAGGNLFLANPILPP